MGSGSAASMMKSVKANRALRRGRNHLFDRDTKGSWGRGQPLENKDPVPIQVRERFRVQLRAERRADRRKLTLSVFLGLLLVISWYFYGEELANLIIHQPSRP